MALLGALAPDCLSALRRVATIGRITNDQVVVVTGANRNTVKKHLQILVSARYLVQRGSGKAPWYSRV